MTKLLFACALFTAAACGGPKTSSTGPAEPGPTQPAPTETAGSGEPSGEQPTDTAPAMTPDECTARGGHVKADIGNGSVACDPTEQSLGPVRLGMEGGLCCGPA